MLHFTPLQKSHFPLLLKWLNTPHVKNWWDPEIDWTPVLIDQKYTTYVDGFKLQDGEKRAIQAYIVCEATIPVGYIQIYNAYDFPRATPLINLPAQLAALDIFIGEESALHKGLGAKIITEFLAQHHDFAYTHILVDPDRDNIAAIRTYENAGFRIVAEHKDANELWMLKENSTAELIKFLELDLLKSSVRSHRSLKFSGSSIKSFESPI